MIRFTLNIRALQLEEFAHYFTEDRFMEVLHDAVQNPDQYENAQKLRRSCTSPADSSANAPIHHPASLKHHNKKTR